MKTYKMRQGIMKVVPIDLWDHLLCLMYFRPDNAGGKTKLEIKFPAYWTEEKIEKVCDFIIDSSDDARDFGKKFIGILRVLDSFAFRGEPDIVIYHEEG